LDQSLDVGRAHAGEVDTARAQPEPEANNASNQQKDEARRGKSGRASFDAGLTALAQDEDLSFWATFLSPHPEQAARWAARRRTHHNMTEGHSADDGERL